MKIYVGNLSFKATDDDLRAAFEPYGEVVSARVIKDKETGRSRGFGFVEMPNQEQGNDAIANESARRLAEATRGRLRNLQVADQTSPRQTFHAPDADEPVMARVKRNLDAYLAE